MDQTDRGPGDRGTGGQWTRGTENQGTGGQGDSGPEGQRTRGPAVTTLSTLCIAKDYSHCSTI